MSAPTKSKSSPVASEEVQRRLAEYRRLGYQRRAPAQVVYQGADVPCPWSDCGLRIAGIHFRLETMGDAALQARWLADWWNGPGLLARCPGCGRNVLFGVGGKQAVADRHTLVTPPLPDDWHAKAHLVVLPAGPAPAGEG